MIFLEDLLSDLPGLVGRMRQYDVRHVALKNAARSLSLTLAAVPRRAASPEPVAPDSEIQDVAVLSPEMGVFRQNSLSADQSVRSGEIIGFVEAGPLRLPVTVTVNGTLSAPLVEAGSVVGYGDTLFRVHPDG